MKSKNCLLFILLLFFNNTGLTAPASRIISFSALNEITQAPVTLDSVFIQNQTTLQDTMLVGVLSIDLNLLTKIPEPQPGLPSFFFLSKNYPNSFEGQTHFQIDVPKTGPMTVELYNILGQRITVFNQTFSAGTHIFSLDGSALSNGIYFLRSKLQNRSQTVKIIKTGTISGSTVGIQYSGTTAIPAFITQKRSAAESFQFTAYAKGFINGILEDQLHEGDKNYQFVMVPDPPPTDFTSQWHGFNLLGLFTVEGNNGGYQEEDFSMISDLGFNFVRLPIDYRTYTKANDWNVFVESGLQLIDRAVEWGQAYGIHVCINLHRAPGYCVNPPSTPLPAAQDVSLWTNKTAQEVFANHWKMFAERYKDVPKEDLSFNLVNEPSNVDGKGYANAVKGAIEAIRSVSPERIIISDAVDAGNTSSSDILAYNVVMSPHFYQPFHITHYKAEWVTGSDQWAEPTWPLYLLANAFYGSYKTPWDKPMVIKGSFTAGTTITLHVYQVSSRADFRIYANGSQIYKHVFVPGAGTGEWKEVIYQSQWDCYQNIYDKDYSTTLTADANEISLQVKEGDWMTFTELHIKPPASSGLPETIAQPGITDWGVPQATFEWQPDKAYMQLVQAPAGFENFYIQNGFIQQWVDLKNAGVPVHVGEWGVYRFTPHDVTLAFMEDRLRMMQWAGLGWALWEFRGSFGILDSGREDVKYENYHGHKLDREMLNLLAKYK
jgi:aryl-phospho-beta-D-glucosidase BglC (GH1 family)